ncbi:DoxX family protein [Chryseobacterium lactis]|uniref:DoxX family protein n=1 Tax=Chryseobacterium lactis TaxID=1241981 RepID=A0A3G6RJM5_CHRLC|nr:DoxX family protein [Chryseobacterium lactis]AZA83688.1 DoxX family protein [Chryseobacterium lactis]AZB04073.1 DoxX family protein [Chryseobacterium lactis]PNW13019.1 DoxX family protein [Chryseobacterium lactis]
MKSILFNFEKNTNNIYILCRILIGLFFFIAGFNKLFHPIFQGYMFNTISTIGFPFPQFTANFTALFECLFGLFLMLGLWIRISSVFLIIIILVALFTHDLSSIPKELIPINPATGVYEMDPFTWLSYFLYLPQTLYLLFLILFLFQGCTGLGIDTYRKKNI